jgi:hypothetical protein
MQPRRLLKKNICVGTLLGPRCLDVGSGVLTAALRTVVGAPYHKSRMTVEHQGATVTCAGVRVGGDESYRLRVRRGESTTPNGPGGARPRTHRQCRTRWSA